MNAAAHRSGTSHWRYAAYGLLGMPLAMSALPVYIQAPAYYSGHLGLAIAGTGWVLFLARLFDTVQDPWLGRCIDRLSGVGLWLWMIAAGLLLALSFLGIWLPPVLVQQQHAALLCWLGTMLMLAYSAHSMINIAYLAWGARLAEHADGLLGAAAWRESAGLVGAVIASVIPGLVLASRTPIRPQLWWYALAFAVLLGVSLLALLVGAPAWHKRSTVGATMGWSKVLAEMAGNRQFRRLLLPYFLNAVSVAIPATLALFFINDRLQAASYAGAFLAVYFLATALGLPLWVAAAKRWGTLQAWRMGMLLAILAFVGAVFLHAGDVFWYALVCLAAGLALGADLALPPVLLAGMIGRAENTAAYYGIWTLLGKLALALSGLTLPLLALLGYQPGLQGGVALGWVYAGLPCVFKLLALLLSATLSVPRPDRLLLISP
jgi:glycoside/pentoside/hexuronide:cation symporter, GPH family